MCSKQKTAYEMTDCDWSSDVCSSDPGGWNWAAVISWFAAFILPLLPYFGASGSFLGFINSINYVWSFVVAFVLYLILMKTGLAGRSFVTEEEHEAFTKRA